MPDVVLAIVGSGAVGGLLAALAHRVGTEVVAVGRPTTAARMAREGIAVRSAQFGSFHAAVAVADQVPAGADVLLAVKSYGPPDVPAQLGEGRPAGVLAVLNGVEHAARLRTALPDTAVAADR